MRHLSLQLASNDELELSLAAAPVMYVLRVMGGLGTPPTSSEVMNWLQVKLSDVSLQDDSGVEICFDISKK